MIRIDDKFFCEKSIENKPCCNQKMTQLTNGAHQSSCNPGNNTSVLNRRWKDKVKPEDPSILYFIHKLYILAYLLSPGPCSLDTACSPGSAQTSWRKVNCQHVLDNLQCSNSQFRSTTPLFDIFYYVDQHSVAVASIMLWAEAVS